MRILDNLEVMLTPSIWFQNYKYSREWDIELRDQLERETFTYPNNYERTKLGNFAVNTTDFRELMMDVRPLRKTMLIARRKYEKDVIKQIREYKK